MVQHMVHICGDILRTNQVQFRWMGTATLRVFRTLSRSLAKSDVWALANVNIILIDGNNKTTSLFSDGFGCDSQNSSSCVIK